MHVKKHFKNIQNMSQYHKAYQYQRRSVGFIGDRGGLQFCRPQKREMPMSPYNLAAKLIIS